MLRIAKGKTEGSIYELSSLKSSLFPFYIYTFPCTETAKVHSKTNLKDENI